MICDWDKLNCVTSHNEYSGSCSGHFCLKSKTKKNPSNKQPQTKKPNRTRGRSGAEGWARVAGLSHRAGDRRGQHQRAALLEPPPLPPGCPSVSLLAREELTRGKWCSQCAWKLTLPQLSIYCCILKINIHHDKYEI